MAPGAGPDPHVFVDDVEVPVLADDDQHHLARVLRVRPGGALTVADGHGRWRRCRFGDDLEAVGAVEVDPVPLPPITIAFALVKGAKPELVVQKLTELGVDRIIPFVARRSVVQWDDDRSAKQLVRLRRVAREAAMQSRRTRLAEVDPVSRFVAVVDLPGAAVASVGGGPPSLHHPTVLIGPEGGWDDDERARFGPTVGLGPQVLRAETAALTAGALLAALRAGIVDPRPEGR